LEIDQEKFFQEKKFSHPKFRNIYKRQKSDIKLKIINCSKIFENDLINI